MIERITVRDFAIVEQASVAFGPGLNIVTGETGAGKSVLIGAVSLVTGGRADRALVRAGAEQCSVEACFTLKYPEAVNSLLREVGLPECEDGGLIIRRTITASGGGRNFINDTSTTVQTLKKVGALVVDMHGPNDNQSLFRQEFQLEILDSAGGHSRPLEAYSKLYNKRRELLERRRELTGDDDSVNREIDLLVYQVNEIHAANLKLEDGDDLVREHADAANAENLVELGQHALQCLSDGEPSAMSFIAEIQRVFQDYSKVTGNTSSDSPATEWLQESKSIAVQIQELARAVEDHVSAIDASPEHLAALDERITLVRRLQSKYGRTVADILDFLAKAEQRLETLQSRGAALEKLDLDIAALELNLAASAAELTKIRTKTAKELEKSISAHLSDLGFKNAKFDVGISKCDFTPSGADLVDFGFAPNHGEPMRPLRDIASSGEIARVMLAIKTVLADHDKMPVLVFDEIDSNIGGEVGNAVGEKMRQIGDKGHQVLCITHLPQVAVFGSRHLVVSKQEVQERTKVTVEHVEGKTRESEVARMLGGENLTSVASLHAREMLARVNRPPVRL